MNPNQTATQMRKQSDIANDPNRHPAIRARATRLAATLATRLINQIYPEA